MHRCLTMAVGCFVAVSTLDAFAAGERVWTDFQGNRVKARFLTITEGIVRLRQDRKPIAIPFYHLCREDREFIRDEMNDRAESNLVPTIGEPRQWTFGSEQFEAEFVGPQKNDIILLRNDKPVTLSFGGFSKEDQEYVRQALVSKGQGHLVPRIEAPAEDGSPGAGIPLGPAPVGPGRSSFPRFGGNGGGGTMAATPAHGNGAASGGGSVPTYTPRGGSSNPWGAGGSHAGAGNVPSYDPSAAGSPSPQPPDIRSRFGASRGLADTINPHSDPASLPQIPSFNPGTGGSSSGSFGLPVAYKYCPKCGKQYDTSATYCTSCSGGFRWRRYGVLGAIVGAVVGIAGAIFRAIRS